MNNRKYTSLNIGCWNINGLGNIYQDKLFLDNVKQYDILCLQETKLSSELPDTYLIFIVFINIDQGRLIFLCHEVWLS